MNKTELVDSMARQLGSSKAEAERALEAFLAGVAAGLKGNREVSIVGFGTFRVTQRAAREGRNPRTGAPLQIAASKSVAFRPGKVLKDAV